MKVVKEGKVRSGEGLIGRGTCYQCGCVVEVEKEELSHPTGDRYCGPSWTYIDTNGKWRRVQAVEVECPTPRCYGRIYVSPEFQV